MLLQLPFSLILKRAFLLIIECDRQTRVLSIILMKMLIQM